jgi:hypothetical protein
LNLIAVVVETHDLATSKGSNFASWATNTTANIENGHVFGDVEAMCEIMFMAGEGLKQRLVDCETTEVERLSPAFFIEISGEIVVARTIIS